MAKALAVISTLLVGITMALPTTPATGSTAFPCITPGLQGYQGPPPGFNPITASDSQLYCYGFPPRPSNPVLADGWDIAMSYAKGWTAPGQLYRYKLPPSNSLALGSKAVRVKSRRTYASDVLPAATPDTNIWGGLGTNATLVPQGAFNGVLGHWIQQRVKVADLHLVADWIGVGGAGDQGPFIQPGTAVFDGCTLGPLCLLYPKVQYVLQFDQSIDNDQWCDPTNHGAPCNPLWMLGGGPKLHAGDGVDVYAFFRHPYAPGTTPIPGSQVVYGWIDRQSQEYTQYITTTNVAGDNPSSPDVEWVVEDTGPNHNPLAVHGYTAYNPVTFATPLYAVDTTGGSTPLENLPLHPYYMGPKGTGNVFLGPSSLFGNGQAFIVCRLCRYTPAPTPTTTSTSATSTATPTATATSTPGSGATISAVTFGGSVDNPSITIDGSGFGSLPTPVPAGCGTSGYDYSSATVTNPLYISDYSAHPASWDAGESNGSCIGLVNLVYSDTQVSYGFGNGYSCCRSLYSLSQGDPFTVGVNGGSCSGSVDYTAPVSCSSAATSTPSTSPTPLPVIPGQAIDITWPNLGQGDEGAYWDGSDGIVFNELPGNGNVIDTNGLYDRCNYWDVLGPIPSTAQCFIPNSATPGLHTISVAEFLNGTTGQLLGSQSIPVYVSIGTALLPDRTPIAPSLPMTRTLPISP